jgi:hypothetical protein
VAKSGRVVPEVPLPDDTVALINCAKRLFARALLLTEPLTADCAVLARARSNSRALVESFGKELEKCARELLQKSP